MEEERIGKIMQVVFERKLCVFPDRQSFDCMEEQIDMSRCGMCHIEYCEKLRRERENGKN